MTHEFEITGDMAGQRLDLAVSQAFPALSRVSVQKAIRDGFCQVDGVVVNRPAQRMLAGQRINFSAPDAQCALKPEEGEIGLVWEDSHLAVCDKAAGITVHPCPSCKGHTFLNRLLYHYPELGAQGGERPGIAHRLDKDTSGLLLVARDEPTRLKLAREFARRGINKEYLALVYGHAPDHGLSIEPIGRDPQVKTRMAVVPVARGGRAAKSEWRKLAYFPQCDISLVAVRIFSGRTHQIRVHMAHAGYPVLGDKVYAPSQVADMAPRQMLHAWKLGLAHPFTGRQLRFQAALPADFASCICHNCRKMWRIAVTGNQGCGKSSFCHKLGDLGWPVISADALVADLYKNGDNLASWPGFVAHPEIFAGDGSIDKSILFDLLKTDPALKRELTGIIHAHVAARIENFWEENEKKGAFAAVAEVPLYFESGWSGKFTPRPFIVGVHCPEEERWSRIRSSRGWDMEKIKTLESWQWPEDRKMAACDLVIDNSVNGNNLAGAAQKICDILNEKDRAREKGIKEKLAAISGMTCASVAGMD